MPEKKKLNAENVDKRVMNRMIREGRLGQTDVESYLGKLPDLSGQCEDIADTVFGTKSEDKSVVSSLARS